MAYTTEADFEKAVVKKLQDYGWKDGVLTHPTEADLVKNWAAILFNNNKERACLNGQPLTEGEMDQIIAQVGDHGTPFALNRFINGKSVTITRDNPADVLNCGKDVSLKIYDRNEIAGGKSTYQIAQQPHLRCADKIYPKRRGDLMLLINGMPVIHIELKKSGIPVSQAVNQLEKYAHERVYMGIFALVQLFVAMNPEETLYFANPGNGVKFPRQFQFHWGDFSNNPVNEWQKVVQDLLSIPMAHQMIGFYTVADEADHTLKVLRSYQYFAASRISQVVAKHSGRWDQGIQRGGYVWHTTGSGKTLTSFKSAQLIAQSGDADKVVFVMDRIELGTQSLNEYRGFAPLDQDVEETRHTDELLTRLANNDDTLIVTSIQKLSLINNEMFARRSSDIERARKKRIVFIVDECHRSVFGDMLITIRQMWRNALFFGFTGTPIFDDNNRKGTTTVDIFGSELHRYTIHDGIRDKNVLGFELKQVQTYAASDLRQAVALDKAKANTPEEAMANAAKRDIYLHYMDSEEVSDINIEGLLPPSQYDSDAHHRKVVENIKRHWTTLSRGRRFHALLAAASIKEAIDYYRLLVEEMPQINVTALFDPHIDNSGGTEYKEDWLVAIIRDYNARYGKDYTITTHHLMKKDIASRLGHRAPHDRPALTPEQQIDILIVVDQMLTGYDSKWINTLYLDKVIEYEGIVQAFSRTNRLFNNEKPFGMIRYYRKPHTMKEHIDKAIKLYSGDREVDVFVSKLDENLRAMEAAFETIRQVFEAEKIENFAHLPEDEARCKVFAQQWQKLYKCFVAARIQGFEWGEQPLAFNEETFHILQQRYRELFEPGGGGQGEELPPYDLDPTLVESDAGAINVEYMNKNFERYVHDLTNNVDPAVLEELREELHRSFASLPIEQQRFARQLLAEVQEGSAKIVEGKDFMSYVVEYQRCDTDMKVHRMALAFGVDEEKLAPFIHNRLTSDELEGHYALRFTEMASTADREVARQFIEGKEGKTLPAYRVTPMIRQYLKDYILRTRPIEEL